MEESAKPRRKIQELSVAEGTAWEGIYTQEQVEAENKYALAGEREDLDRQHDNLASDEKKWAVDRFNEDGAKETSLLTDRELDQETDRIAAERAAGDQVELRLATPEECEQDQREQEQGERDQQEQDQREQDQREQDQREQDQREQDQREREQQEQRDLKEHQEILRTQEQQHQLEQDQKQEPDRESDKEHPERGQEKGSEGQQQEERSPGQRTAEDWARGGKEHYYAIQPEKGPNEYWRYRDDQAQQADRGQDQPDQTPQRTSAQTDNPERSREPAGPSEPTQMEMEIGG
jgi:hypothetical protein